MGQSVNRPRWLPVCLLEGHCPRVTCREREIRPSQAVPFFASDPSTHARPLCGLILPDGGHIRTDYRGDGVLRRVYDKPVSRPVAGPRPGATPKRCATLQGLSKNHPAPRVPQGSSVPGSEEVNSRRCEFVKRLSCHRPDVQEIITTGGLQIAHSVPLLRLRCPDFILRIGPTINVSRSLARSHDRKVGASGHHRREGYDARHRVGVGAGSSIYANPGGVPREGRQEPAGV